MTKKYRLAVVTTNPIQYQAPLWRKLAESRAIDPTVFFVSRRGSEARLDPDFGQEFAWDVPLLDGYAYEFLPSFSLPGVSADKKTRWGPTGALVPTALTKRLAATPFDGVLIQGYASGAAWAGTVAAWRTGIPVIVRGESHDRGRTRSWWQTARREVVSRWMRHVDMVIAIGALNRDMWRGMGIPDERILLSPYAVDNERFVRTLVQQPDRAAELRRSWDAGPDDVVFLFAGKLTTVKSPEVLLTAFASLPPEARAHLVFVGSGPLDASLRSMQEAAGPEVSERVHWAGFVNQHDIAHYYHAADVMVLPSRIEPWGLVVNEALACGTPCIVSDMVGSGPDLVEAFRAGTVFPAGDAAALGRCLETALDVERRRQWSSRIDQFRQHVSLDGNVDAITEALEIVSRKRSLRTVPVTHSARQETTW